MSILCTLFEKDGCCIQHTYTQDLARRGENRYLVITDLTLLIILLLPTSAFC